MNVLVALLEGHIPQWLRVWVTNLCLLYPQTAAELRRDTYPRWLVLTGVDVPEQLQQPHLTVGEYQQLQVSFIK